MSYLSVRGEQNNEDEIESLENLSNLIPSADGEFIRKISATQFENAIPTDSVGVTDHGALTGLLDDDHTQYVKKISNLSDLDNVATTRANLGLDSGGQGDIWVEKAGDTMTGNLSATILSSTSLTASELTATDASKNLVSLAVATYPSLTELTYVKGVRSEER